jgi:2-polyprenyl-6-methoxyphenol hydroxylase-like FAD-dependent oxidoreductase
MRVLVSGAGIAGPTLAYWLHRYGFVPTLVERSPTLRTGGYIVDFWGAGYDVADRMGLIPELQRKGYQVQEVRMVGRNGQKTGGFSASVFDRYTDGRFTSIPRGELAATLFGTLHGEVETLFGDSVCALESGTDGIHVQFEQSPSRDFDLVIGADGLHSNIRELAFDRGAAAEKYLGYQVAAFEAPGYRPRDEDVYVMYTEVGQQVARFSMRGDRTLFLFVFVDEEDSASTFGFNAGDVEVDEAVDALRILGKLDAEGFPVEAQCLLDTTCRPGLPRALQHVLELGDSRRKILGPRGPGQEEQTQK